MIDIQVPMMRWTRSRGLIALLEEIGAPKKLTTPLTVKNGESIVLLQQVHIDNAP